MKTENSQLASKGIPNIVETNTDLIGMRSAKNMYRNFNLRSILGAKIQLQIIKLQLLLCIYL